MLESQSHPILSISANPVSVPNISDLDTCNGRNLMLRDFQTARISRDNKDGA